MSNVIAVTASSESYPASELRQAKELAERFGFRHIIIETKELDCQEFRKNPVNRCYYCKGELFKKLKDIAASHGLDFVLDGSTFDDLSDMRYGRKAAKEIGVESPIEKAGITKDEIRTRMAVTNHESFPAPVQKQKEPPDSLKAYKWTDLSMSGVEPDSAKVTNDMIEEFNKRHGTDIKPSVTGLPFIKN